MNINAYHSGWYEAEVTQLCYLVGAGKPVGSVQAPTKLVTSLEAICDEAGCLHYAEGCEGHDGWTVLFVYQKSLMLDVIRHSRRFDDDSAVGVWFKGMMYGYSLDEVEKFVEKSGLRAMLGSPPVSI